MQSVEQLLACSERADFVLGHKRQVVLEQLTIEIVVFYNENTKLRIPRHTNRFFGMARPLVDDTSSFDTGFTVLGIKGWYVTPFFLKSGRS